MFGYVICNRNDLEENEYKRYRSSYCGLCIALKKKYGNISRLALNYDMTFLAMMLNSLYNDLEVLSEEEKNYSEKNIRCVLHPTKNRNIFINRYLDYAADMTVLLMYYKCLDDIEDEGKLSAKMYKGVLNKAYKKIAHKYPRQTECVRKSLCKLSELEYSGELTPDMATNLSGVMLSEIFVYKEDYFAENLRQFGYELGRFIYLIDATVDYENDIKKKSYNPLIDMKKKPEDMHDILEQAIGNATYYFEKMPIITDESILRNVLYSGVWQKYYMKINRKVEKNGK